MTNAFVNGLNKTQVARTANGAKTLPTSGSALVDLFFLAGSSRGKDIRPAFTKAYSENREVALRTALWARDIRQGAGERQIFRDILLHLEATDFSGLAALLPRVADLGRWDDLLVLKSDRARELVFTLVQEALNDKDKSGLVAKWMPRKGEDAVALRKFLNMSPKQYRKTLVTRSNTVEQRMCAREWTAITYDHVPSQASKRYRKAFFKHDPEGYKAYVEALKKPVVPGQKPERKINAGAIFPHDVISDILNTRGRITGNALDVATAQWNALPDFVGEGSFIPLSDVSGSMGSLVPGGSTPMINVSIGLGMYLAERNKGAFKDIVLHFSDNSYIEKLEGTLAQRISQYYKDVHMGSTNLESAFNAILQHAVKNNVPQEDMPQNLLIISDMEFNATCYGSSRYGEMTNFDKARQMYAEAGYDLPNIIFWNLNGREKNAPVKADKSGTALVSGFSPAIVKSVLAAKKVTPLDIMLDTVMSDRYKLAM